MVVGSREKKKNFFNILILVAPSDLCKFDWKEVSGSINEKSAVSSLNYCTAYRKKRVCRRI